MNSKNAIPPYEYLKGEDFVEMLKEKLRCRSHQELSELLDVPKSTFSTWSKFDRTSHELMVRLHLALSIPMAELALKPEDKARLDLLKKQIASGREPDNTFVMDEPRCDVFKQQISCHNISTSCLTNGKLIDTGWIAYPVRRFNSYGLEPETTFELETNDAHYLIDKRDNDPVSGNYLISIDDRYSLNHIQRLPGKKLAVSFGGNTLEIGEHDIKVLGRVAVELKKF